jgi:hypothetical protein
MHLRKLTSLSLALAALSLAPMANGAVLLLDFGPTTTTDFTNSPYHTASGSVTDTTWNKVTEAWAGAASVVWSDNTSTPALTLDIGGTTAPASTTLGLGNLPSGNGALVGSSVSTGVYAGTSVGRDGIFTGSSNASTRAVGFQLAGLTTGTYDVYVLARQTNTGATSQIAYVGASGTSGDFDYSGYANQTVAFTGNTHNVTSWVEGANYMKFTLNLTTGQYLNLAVAGVTGDARGFLNAVEIVAVPEAHAGALLLGAAGMLCIIRRRRRG